MLLPLSKGTAFYLKNPHRTSNASFEHLHHRFVAMNHSVYPSRSHMNSNHNFAIQQQQPTLQGQSFTQARKEVMHPLPQLSVSNWIAALSGQSLRNLSVYQHNIAPKITKFWQSVAANQPPQCCLQMRSASGGDETSQASSGSSDVLATFTCPVQGNLTVLPTFSLGSVYTAVRIANFVRGLFLRTFSETPSLSFRVRAGLHPE